MQAFQFGNLSYVRHYENIGTFQAGVLFNAYGRFQGTDASGQLEGEFRAGETAFIFGGARAFDRYALGANVKMIFGSYASQFSFASALDLSASYTDSAKLFTATIVARNIGVQFDPFVPGNRDPLPFDLLLGFSKRLKHFPLRIGLTAHSLQRFKIRYEESEEPIAPGSFQTQDKESGFSRFADQFARHFIFQGEFYLKKVVTLGFGYNHQRRKEMIVDARSGLTGFSFGIGLHIKAFDFQFARGRYHLAGAANHISIVTDLGGFRKKQTLEQALP